MGQGLRTKAGNTAFLLDMLGVASGQESTGLLSVAKTHFLRDSEATVLGAQLPPASLLAPATNTYSSSVGRWTQPDPVAGNIADPATLNRYVYVAGDPVNFVDPDGLKKKKKEGIPTRHSAPRVERLVAHWAQALER